MFSRSPLSRRSVHDDVDPQDLHGVQRVGEVHQRRQGDEGECRNAPGDQQGETEGSNTESRDRSVTDGGLYSRAQLEANKVFDVVVNSFSLLDGRPADRKQTPTFEPQTLQSQLNDRNKLFH